MYKFGTVVLVPFPYTDLSRTKVRPAVILSKKKSRDIIVAYVSSQFSPSDVSMHVFKNTSAFMSSGLKVASSIRLDKLATVHNKKIYGELGHIPHIVLNENKMKFVEQFGFEWEKS